MSFYPRFIQCVEQVRLLWQSLDAGRAPIFNQAYVNCKYPQNTTEYDRDETGKQHFVT